jgi:hypothetical protein
MLILGNCNNILLFLEQLQQYSFIFGTTATIFGIDQRVQFLFKTAGTPVVLLLVSDQQRITSILFLLTWCLVSQPSLATSQAYEFEGIYLRTWTCL